MPVWRLQCSFAADTALPRDRFVITPHFNDGGVLQDLDQLCGDLAAALHTWTAGSGTREIKVTAYDAQGTPPVLPQGEAIVNPDLAPVSGVFREAALCLSFYGNVNQPRSRGRVYIPAPLFLAPGASIPVRPTAPQMAKVGALAPIFENLGGAGVDWSIFSRADNAIRSVKNWWVDNEWDVMRSRGMRGTDRLTGTTSEA
jgi:hypothetical protein